MRHAVAGRSRLMTASAVTAAGLVLLTVASFLPWVQIGERSRSTFELTGVLARLGFDGWQGALLRLWPFSPLVTSGAVALLALGRRRGAAIVAAVIGALALIVGLVARSIPDQSQIGPTVAIAGGFLALIASVVLLATRQLPDRQLSGKETP
jgi:hypothetical protein